MLLTQLFTDAIRAHRRDPQSPSANRAIRLAEKAARSTAPVLLEGEPGTGGDALARAIHACGERRAKPFVRIHAGGRPEEIRAALFGIEAGSGCRHPGRIAEAQGGSLLIQGVEELPADVQAALLRLVQDGEIEPVGAKRATKVDVRVIATTHANLIERVRRGAFREDLYYRLHVLPIALSPLRARPEEIALHADALLRHFAAEEGKGIRGLSAEALGLLAAYDWPGNLRQLENVLFRAVALAEGEHLTPAEFPQIAARVGSGAIQIPPLPEAAALRLSTEAEPREEPRDPHALSLVGEDGQMRRLEELEAAIIRFAIGHYRGHMSAVSRHLGIGRSTLYRKLKDLGLSEGAEDGAAAAPARTGARERETAHAAA